MPVSRRDFLKRAGLAGTVLVLGFRLRPAVAAATPATLRPDGWLAVGRDGRVAITVGKSEMGQGVRTVLPMIAAEELGVPWAQVDLVQAEPGPDFPHLGTGGSRSVETLWEPLRRSAAAAREMLIAAAAARWKVEPSACQGEHGAVVHVPTGRSLLYGRLVEAAARMPVPREPPLKPASAYTLLGRPTRRVDGPRIVDGTAVYGLDVRLPGMKQAVVVRCPVPGGRARTWKAGRTRAHPGVREVVAIGSGIAVVADSTWQAMAAARALEVTWDPGPLAGFSSETFRTRLEELSAVPGLAVRDEGDAPGTLAGSARRLAAVYEFPWQPHLTLEPPNCVASARKGSCEIWTGCQRPNDVQAQVAARLGLPLDAVRVHVPLLGGGFGRRLNSEYAVEAAELSWAVRGPVQVVYTRPDDLQHDFYHPMSLHRLEAALDRGTVGAWLHRISAPSIASAFDPAVGAARIAKSATNGAADVPYRIPHLKVEFARAECHVPLGYWRGIEVVPNVYARECFLDEIAAALGRDPLDLRLELLGPARIVAAGEARIDTGRLRRVLETAAERAGWGTPLPPGRGRGLACCAYDGRTYVAEVAEASLDAAGALKVHRVTAAADCGLVLNPLGAAGQVESGIVWGLSALRTRISFKDGRAEQQSLAELPVWRLDETPRIEVHLVDSQAPPSGLGEPPVPPLIPAVLNAVYAASGRRIRTLPVA